MSNSDSEYVVRCIGCGHKMGTTPYPEETTDVCDRCDQRN